VVLFKEKMRKYEGKLDASKWTVIYAASLTVISHPVLFTGVTNANFIVFSNFHTTSPRFIIAPSANFTPHFASGSTALTLGGKALYFSLKSWVKFAVGAQKTHLDARY
jgi:hypothetical protein